MKNIMIELFDWCSSYSYKIYLKFNLQKKTNMFILNNITYSVDKLKTNTN